MLSALECTQLPESLPLFEGVSITDTVNVLVYLRLNMEARGAWWAAVHGVAKSQTHQSNFPFTFHFHALEKEMATHSSVLAWRIPGTGDLVGCRLWGRTELDTTEVTAGGWRQE